MVPFLDIAMAVWVKQLFPKYTVAYAPPEQDRQALALETENKSAGLPGITVYRTSCPKWIDAYNSAQPIDGVRIGRDMPRGNKYEQAGVVPVRPVYTVKAWTDRLLDRDHVERTFSFATEWKTINYKILTEQGGSIGSSTPLSISDPSYQHIPDANTGSPLLYCVQYDIVTNSSWMQTFQIPAIEQLLLSFEFMGYGEVPTSVFDRVKVEFGTPESPRITR